MKISSFKDIYDQERLEKDLVINGGRPYQQCALSVMDTIADPNITFDENGISNYYYEYKEAVAQQGIKGSEGRKLQEEWAEKIKASKKTGEYNCLLGLSGGADSTYLAYLAKDLGLNPILVNFDYGWNSEIATINIENTVKNTGFDLYTIVMNWEEFKNLQRSYFKASVLDLDVPADHMIFGTLYKMAAKFKVKYILSGHNVWTEHTLPKTWNYDKFDLANLKNIHRRFENTPLKELPALGFFDLSKYNFLYDFKRVNFLDLQEYNRKDIIKVIEDRLEWKNYGWKHHESIFTRFYQGFILPWKFKIDKRKAHYSNLIFSGQMTKKEVLEAFEQPPYPIDMMNEDFEYIAKKLGFSLKEFEEILTQVNIPHEFYGTDKVVRERYFNFLKTLKPVSNLAKKILGR